MLNLKKHLIIGLSAAGIVLTTMSSFAQMPPPGPGPDMQHPPSAEQIAKFEQEHAKRQAKLHDKLKITPAQEEAWKTFVAKTAPVRPATPPTRMSKEEWSKLTTPQRLDQQQEHMKQQQDKMAQHVAATKDFYAVLSPEQQKLFDDAFRKMQQRRFEHGHEHGEARGK